MFIKYVLRYKDTKPGLYGTTKAYYGTVEQQGRLTLHLYMVIWIMGCPTPQELRERVLNPASDFQKAMVEYLEDCHMGEFINGTLSDIKDVIDGKAKDDHLYVPPTLTLPKSPPVLTCRHKGLRDDCNSCRSLLKWREEFDTTVDDLIFRSNKHRHNPGCMDNKHKTCKARFPRDVFPKTSIDPETRHISMRKGEAWINTFTYTLTYLLRSNSDVTCLMSGTAIKAIIAYITDYVTKTPLSSNVIFQAVKSVFDK
ncbi:hypothetical protein OF83DRAFT_1063411, partial [Amylostereum chailletii]